MQYELYYWPTIQGRGEFVRLALEDGKADYLDVARLKGKGAKALLRAWEDTKQPRPPFAPPFLRAGKVTVAQTALILHFLGPKLNQVPTAETSRMWAHQLQLTISDFVDEIHDTHHPVGSGLYYEEQRGEAMRRAECFREQRAPRFLGYFESVLQASAGKYLLGRQVSYVDLSMFQIVAGLRYAFPRLMSRLEGNMPGLVGLHDRIAQRPNVAAYLDSPRRIPFNEDGVFRNYPELDS